MSTINTNGIDVNYPIPGQNNSSQGFRDNFTNIKQNLNIAADEISDLQNKVVLKSALANSTLNNDMANTLIANASTLQFRATTYNLGNNLIDNITVDCSLGDLQYGNLGGNVTLNFGSWAPTDTQSTVKLQLGRPNNEENYTITFSGNAKINQNSGWSLLENSGTNGSLATLTFPYDTTRLDLTVTSTDCGISLNVEPTNRPYKTTQIQNRTPLPQGSPGDTLGTVCVDSEFLYVCTSSYVNNNPSAPYTGLATFSSGNRVIIDGTVPDGTPSFEGRAVIFSQMKIDGIDVTSFGNIISGRVYYVKSIDNSGLGGDSALTLSTYRATTGTAPTVQLTTVPAATNTVIGSVIFYDGPSIWKRASLTSLPT